MRTACIVLPQWGFGDGSLQGWPLWGVQKLLHAESELALNGDCCWLGLSQRMVLAAPLREHIGGRGRTAGRPEGWDLWYGAVLEQLLPAETLLQDLVQAVHPFCITFSCRLEVLYDLSKLSVLAYQSCDLWGVRGLNVEFGVADHADSGNLNGEFRKHFY